MQRLRNIPFLMLLLISILLATASVVGKICNEEIAYDSIYGAPWMMALWTLFAIISLIYIFAARKAMASSAFRLHISMAVILAGAGITYIFGQEGDISLRTTDTEDLSMPTDVMYGKKGKRIQLPFSLSLKDCDIEYYPATSTPASYSATLLVSEDGGKPEAKTVSINKILKIKRYRIYLAGISDTSCTLKVSHDPWGIGVTYAGYILFALAGLFFFFSKKKGYRAFVKGMAVAVMFMLPVGFAAASPHEPVAKAPQKAIAENFGKLRVCYQGRVTPVASLAKDFCVAVYGINGYKGLTSEQVLMGWIFNYDQWKNEPFIKIKGKALKNALNTDVNYARLTDFYSKGQFVPNEIPEADADNEVIKAIERVDFISRIATGSDLKIFPVTLEDSMTEKSESYWVSWVDNLPADTDIRQWQMVKHTMANVAKFLQHGKNIAANEELMKIIEWQDEFMNSQGIDDKLRMKIELLYVDWGTPKIPIIIIAIGLLITLKAAMSRSEIRKSLISMAETATAGIAGLYVLLMLVARGYIGGYFPMTNGFETMLAISLFAMILGIIFAGKRRSVSSFAIVVSLMALAVAAMSEKSVVVSHLVPVLNSPWLTIHVMAVMTSYTLFAVMAVAGAVSLAKRKQRGFVDEMSRFNRAMLFPAVFLLGLGIFIGAVWANQSWGRYWGWDAKETWALITFFVYSFPLHIRSFGIRHKVFNIYLLCAFPVVLITYFGVNFLLGGLHSYAG